MILEKIRDRECLIDYLDRGNEVEYLFFLGHQPSKNGEITKSCFSQWFMLGFDLDGIHYPTAEHYMMASKARLFNDRSAEHRILQAKHPRDTQRIGREVSGFNEAVWQANRFDLVVSGNLAKFGQNEPLKEFLINTQNRVIVEASPDDRIWGIGLAYDRPEARNPIEWLGLNLLGFALMEVRSQLANY